MGLQEEYFNSIKHGTKKYEVRLNDIKRRKLKIGDIIYFQKEPERRKTIKTKITNILKFQNFNDLLDNIEMEDLASISINKEKYLEDLEKFYPKEEQEKYGVIAIEIERQEKSCGMIIFKNDRILLVHHIQGHWGLPKGHVEENETEIETAKREVLEETGIIAKQVTDFRGTITYSPRYNTKKEVVFFIGEAENDKITPQLSEVEEARYVDIKNIKKYIKKKNERELIAQAIEYHKEFAR